MGAKSREHDANYSMQNNRNSMKNNEMRRLGAVKSQFIVEHVLPLLRLAKATFPTQLVRS